MLSLGHKWERTMWLSAALSLVLASGVMAANVLLAPRRPPTYTVGSTFDVPVPTGDRDETVIVWFDTRCGACVKSVSFLQELSSDGYKVIITTPQVAEEVSQFLSSKQYSPAAVISTNGEWHSFVATPTVLTLDGASKVVDVWVGMNDAAAIRKRLLARRTAS